MSVTLCVVVDLPTFSKRNYSCSHGTQLSDANAYAVHLSLLEEEAAKSTNMQKELSSTQSELAETKERASSESSR